MGRVVRGEDKWLFGSQRPERGLSQGALMGKGWGSVSLVQVWGMMWMDGNESGEAGTSAGLQTETFQCSQGGTGAPGQRGQGRGWGPRTL